MKIQVLRQQCPVMAIDGAYERSPLHVATRWLEDRHQLLLLLYSLCYFACVCVHAKWRPLWYDEFFTYYLSKLTPAELSMALAGGVDLTPPLLHLLTKLGRAVVGDNNISTRWTAIAGFWIASLCVFSYTRRRTSALFGFIALSGMFVTFAYKFAYEARSYGLMLGFTGLALVCWQREGERTSIRGWWTLGTAVSLLGLVASHLYGLFVVAVFAGAEVIRQVRLRSFHLPMLVALLCSVIPLVLLHQQIASARAYSANFWARADWAAFVGTYHLFLTSGIVAVLVAALGTTLMAQLLPGEGEGQDQNRLPLEEIALPLGLTLLPVAQIVAARLVTGAYVARYAISATVGITLLFAFFTAVVTARRQAMGLVVLLCFAGWTGLQLLASLSKLRMPVDAVAVPEMLREALAEGPPVVITDGAQYLQLHHYHPEFATRIYSLVDIDFPGAYGESDTTERTTAGLARWTRLNTAKYADFVAGHRTFLVFYQAGGEGKSWILSKLADDRRDLRLRKALSGMFLYEVGPPPRGASSDLLP
ncbi:MAG: hypothetical protein JNK87_07200 [Bryobacterales bacterium]|nr:hypothetical protein [Bryobacterales bacterium]